MSEVGCLSGRGYSRGNQLAVQQGMFLQYAHAYCSCGGLQGLVVVCHGDVQRTASPSCLEKCRLRPLIPAAIGGIHTSPMEE
eukprot:8391432-Ditylum_brightwellii.AAC.1